MKILELARSSGAFQPDRLPGVFPYGLRGSQKRSGSLVRSRAWWAQWWAHLAAAGEKGRARTPVVASVRRQVSTERDHTHVANSVGCTPAALFRWLRNTQR